MIRRALELGWPTALVGATCAGLALSNWVRLPAVVLVASLAGCVAALLVEEGWARLALLGAALAVLGIWWGGTRLEALDRSLLEPRIGMEGRARVVVTGPVRRTRFSARMPAEVRQFAGLEIVERVLLQLPVGRAPPEQGAVLELVARPVAPRGPETGFDERGWLARKGVHVVLRGGAAWRVVGRRGGIGGVGDRLRGGVARALASGTSGERRALVAGIVLGADEGLDDELQDAFKRSGLYHLLAVSGQNVGFVALGVLFLAWVAGLPRIAGHVLALVGIGAYVIAVGWQPSVARAGVAAAVASLAWLASRPAERWHALALGALVLLTWTPASLLEPGFQLSFAAVAAIFVTVPRLRRLWEGTPLPWKVVELAGIAAACGAATAPVLLLQFGSVPVWTVLANSLAEPAMPLLLGSGLLAALVAPVVPSAAVALSWIAGWCAAWIAACARLVASLPFAEVSSPAVVLAPLGVAAAIVAWPRIPPYRRRSLALLVAAALPLVAVGWWALQAPPRWTPPAGLRVTFLDVGQGDAALLEVPEGALLVDQGPPEAAVAKQLRELGIRSLSAVVLTHPQRDHIGGAADVLRRVRVGGVLDPGIPAPSADEEAALAVARSHGVPLRIVRSGQSFSIGRLRVRVLWPDGPGPPAADPNDHAVVLLASYGATDVLLTADAESNVTGRLPLRQVEVLKVAHHGSEDPGLPEQLRILRPRVAVISVGRGNDYGHPRAETLVALRSVSGLALYRTDENGRVIVESDGKTFSVHAQR
jgi:competence protein ComEC